MPEPQALEGLRVLECTSAMAGPWIGRFMAWCGAEVIRVESQKRPDVVRLYVPPWDPERGTEPCLSPWFTDWNAGKRFIAIDLTRPEASEIIGRLVSICDVVVENQTPGVMEKLGLGYAALREARGDLVMLSTSGYGDSGPCSRYVTWGPNVEALSGLSTMSGFPASECTITQYAYPHTVSAMHGLFAEMCALDHRLRTGEGQYINLSQYETTVSALGDVMMEQLVNGREPTRLGNRSPTAAPQGCYRCAGDDRWIVLSIETEEEWERFCDVTGHPQWKEQRGENAEKLDGRIEAWTSMRNDYEIMAELQSVGVRCGVVQNVEDLQKRDRHLKERDFFEQVEHLCHPKGPTVLATGIPLGLTGTPGSSGRTGAAVGQDNDYVFRELLGMSTEEFQRYVDAGAIERS